MQPVLDRVPSPSYPLTEDWEISVAAMLRMIPRVPKIATKPLGMLDRMGAIHIGLHKVGFDGNEVPWDKVVEIRTHDVRALMADQLVEYELARWRRVLPPVPGRAWVVGKAGELLVTLVLAAVMARSAGKDAVGALLSVEAAHDDADDVARAEAELKEVGAVVEAIEDVEAIEAALDETEVELAKAALDEADVEFGEAERIADNAAVITRVPAEIVYRTTLRRRRTTQVSLTSMLLLMAIPSATPALLETARSKEIVITDVPPTDADLAKSAQRAQALVNRLALRRRKDE
ncbi:hypothetical protein F7O44_05960 [Phytoactinopolyspora sp. XMNu-373]|uniref:Uncharacterized protein n=1 Tax=Phytoactinopolyspora mesophila TaxID=2650750 RepID=A0A7K3LZZ8_9ACTN|nr:hypothetical protein [Phytoactinopolyspora mesophila]